jgi:hypothetical protein
MGHQSLMGSGAGGFCSALDGCDILSLSVTPHLTEEPGRREPFPPARLTVVLHSGGVMVRPNGSRRSAIDGVETVLFQNGAEQYFRIEPGIDSH